MVIEICVAIATGVFVVLAVFLVRALHSLTSTLKQTKSFLFHAQKDLHALSEETVGLIKEASETVADVKMKSESLNFLFKPMYALSHKHAPSKKKKPSEKAAQILEWANIAVDVYNKVKKGR